MSEAENVSTKARLVARSKDMLWMRDTLINIRDELETDVDRVYFGSTNDADDFRDIVKQLDDWQWSVIMKDAEGEDLLGQIRTLCTTLSRQAELLGRAQTALAPFASFGEYMESETEGFADEDELSIETENAVLDRFCVGAFRLASSTLDAIRDELKGEQG